MACGGGGGPDGRRQARRVHQNPVFLNYVVCRGRSIQTIQVFDEDAGATSTDVERRVRLRGELDATAEGRRGDA